MEKVKSFLVSGLWVGLTIMAVTGAVTAVGGLFTMCLSGMGAIVDIPKEAIWTISASYAAGFILAILCMSLNAAIWAFGRLKNWLASW